MDRTFKKILKRIFLVFLCFVLFLLLGVYLILRYRIKYVLSQVVKIETNNTYKLDFSDLSFSLLKGDVKIKNASFNSIKPVAGKTSYEVKIPDFYFSLESWRPLLLHKKLVIDSIYIASPKIKILEPENDKENRNAGLELYNIYSIVKQATNKLEIQTVKIKEASLDFYSAPNDYSFKINHVDFLLNNFTRRKHSASHFLLSDDIGLSIKGQRWVLPNGNIFGFSNLYFSGGDQYFAIDSCFLKTGEKGHHTSITASKFFFSSSHLPSVYLENKLLIDTLSCISPIIEIETNDKTKNEDTTALLTRAFARFFSQTYFKYISVVDGQLSLVKKENDRITNYQSQKANLRLYDLDIHSGHSPSFSLGDIEFELDTLEFFSPDSVYRLRMTKLSIEDGNLICKNASFDPVFKKNDSGVNLVLPKIVFNNIDLEELLQKKLKAKYAQFDHPEIFVFKTDAVGSKNINKPARVNALYTALHSLRDLINVDAVYINHGDLHISHSGEATVNGSNMNAIIRLNDLFKSDYLVDIKAALLKLSFDRFQLKTPTLKLILENSNAKGPVQENKIKRVSAYLKNGMEIRANNIYWSKLDWDILYNDRKIDLDKINIDKLNIRYKQTPSKTLADRKSEPFFHANSFTINNLGANVTLLDGTEIKTNGNDLVAINLSNGDRGLQWSNITAKFQNSTYSKAATKIVVDVSVFDKQKGSTLKNVNITIHKNQFIIPEIKLGTSITSTKLSNLHLQYLVLNEPTISVLPDDINTSERNLMIPFNLNVDKTEINKASFQYHSQPADSLQLTGIADITIDSLHMFKQGDNFLNYQFCEMQFTNTEMINKEIIANISLANVIFTNSKLQKNEKNKLNFTGDSKLQWADADFKLRDSSKFLIKASNLSGEIMYPSLSIGEEKKFDPISIVGKLKIIDGNLFYSDNAKTITASQLMLNGAGNDLELEKIAITPNKSRDLFFKTSEWQKDYMEVNCGKLSVQNIDLQKLLRDTAVDIKEITIQDASLVTSRDKTIPFEHGIEKLMPTKLIQTIHRPFSLQTVIIKNASITSNEIASATKREGSVPFISLNGEIRNVNNKSAPGDSLIISANAVFLGHYIRSFRYKESYNDSLSGFRMIVRMSPMDLTVLTSISNPLAAVNIDRGNSDTLFERIAGNKYAALGEMKFYYRGLKIRILDPLDTTKKNLALSFKNLVANKFVLKSSNKKLSRVFFIRDTEKFIFNYWFKTTFSGVMTSAGMKNSKKYLKQYREVKDDYSLPSQDNW